MEPRPKTRSLVKKALLDSWAADPEAEAAPVEVAPVEEREVQ